MRRALLRTPLLLGGAALLLAGCSAYEPENFPTTAKVIDRADYLARKPLPPLTDYQVAAQARVTALLAEPLSLSAALEIAMLNDPGLQQHYQAAQIWDEDLVAEIAAGGALPADWRAAHLALLKSVNTVSRYDFPAEYLDTTADFIEVGEMVRKDYFTAVAALEIEAMLQQAATATQAAAELAAAQYRAGTASRRAEAQQQMVHAEMVKAMAEAKLDSVAAREALNRRLGLWGVDAAWTSPGKLPDLPEQPPRFDGLEAYALVHRADTLAERKSWALWQQAIEARSEVRENLAVLETRYQLAAYQRDTVLPLATTILQETQKEYNGMLMGVYDLLTDTRGAIDAGRAAVETLRDYWIAEAELTQAVGGRLPQ